MVTQIQLGNIYQQNGKTVVGGSQSAIDTESLINSLATAKRIPATKLEDKIKVNESKSTALTSLKDILTRLKDASDLLRNPPGVQNASKNIFAYRSTNVATNTGADASSYVGVTAQPGTNIQSFAIDSIAKLAKETKQDTGTFSLPDANTSVVGSTPATGMFNAGTFALRNATGGADISITLADGDSLQTVANKFNAVKNQTGIQATVLKVATGSPNNTYKIVYTATQTGTTYGFDLKNAGTVKSGSNVFDDLTITTSQPANNAEFTIDNVLVTRETNSVNDLIDGMTFNLKQPTPPGTSVAVNVIPDTDSVKSAITSFVDIYNEFRVFFAKQTELGDDGLAKDTAVLNGNNTLRNISSNVASEVATIVAGISGGDPSRLADIGINFTDFAGDSETPLTRNIMQINSEKLASALSSNFEGVQNLFEYSMTSDNSDLATFSRTNALNATSITMNIDRTNGTYTATYVDKSGISRSTNFTAEAIAGTNSISLTGAQGSGLEGMVFIYSSSADATVNITVSQGISDRLFNVLDGTLQDNGTLANEINSVTDSSKRYQEEVTRIDDQISKYRDQLQTQYAALEAALSKANNILQVLDAQTQAQNNGN